MLLLLLLLLLLMMMRIVVLMKRPAVPPIGHVGPRPKGLPRAGGIGLAPRHRVAALRVARHDLARLGLDGALGLLVGQVRLRRHCGARAVVVVVLVVLGAPVSRARRRCSEGLDVAAGGGPLVRGVLVPLPPGRVVGPVLAHGAGAGAGPLGMRRLS